ncbi:MAG: BamA/TamA family outer membrane protein [Pseudomonadota bacterium]
MLCWARCASATAVLVLAACSNGDEDLPLFVEPDTAVSYELTIEGAPDEEILSLLEQSLALSRQQEKGAQSLAFLRRRGEGDVATAQKIMRSRGYYEASFDVAVEELPPEEDEGTRAEGAEAEELEEPETRAIATFTVNPGRAFTLTSHRLILIDSGGAAPDPLEAAALGSPVGDAAAAAGIVAAEQGAVAELRRNGRPYATFRSRDAVADLEAATLEVESIIATGPFYRFGDIAFTGNPSVEEAYLRTYVPWEPGAVFDVDALKAYQTELFGTGLFSGASVSPPDDPPESDSVPILVTLDEAPFRTVTLGTRYSTDDGPAVRGSFEHRNLFGANETFGVTLEAGLEEQILGFTYLEPQFLRDGQDFTAGLELRHIEDDAFDEIGGTLTVGLQREVGAHWIIGAGGLLEASLLDEGDGDEEVYLAGLPVFALYDSTDDTLDATRGQRARFSITPFAGLFDSESTFFTKLEARGSAYQDLLGDRRFVLAERGRIGSIVAADNDLVPATRRFFSGGGGSVRGYQEDFIGPIDADNDPEGGLSVAEAGIELRARVFGDLGVAIFTEAGVVSDDALIDLSAGVQVAAGLGFRYYSPIGPLRFDIAFPLNARDVDDSFQAYISIGQAF